MCYYIIEYQGGRNQGKGEPADPLFKAQTPIHRAARNFSFEGSQLHCAWELPFTKRNCLIQGSSLSHEMAHSQCLGI